MQRNDERLEGDLIDLGDARVETKGNDGNDIDMAHQRLQGGLSDD
ncbi:benenodin family lasso peptide [Sphingomonas panacis]|nr:benenodin family lasso peptide [Sphingomonas panacis]